jgi:curved DNA-binding protein CbpA
MLLSNFSTFERIIFYKNGINLNNKTLGILYCNLNFACNKLHTSTINYKDYYDVLNVKRNANRQEIKHAYYKLSKQFHPDVNSSETAENVFKEIQEAYNTLGDETKRKEYDGKLFTGNTFNDSFARGMGQQSPFAHREFRKKSDQYYRPGTYDFEEHFKSHYGKNMKDTHGYAHGYGYGSESEEELKKYWNKKEFSSFDKFRKKLYYRLIGFVMLYFFIYTALTFSKEKEETNGYKGYRNQVNGKNER